VEKSVQAPTVNRTRLSPLEALSKQRRAGRRRVILGAASIGVALLGVALGIGAPPPARAQTAMANDGVRVKSGTGFFVAPDGLVVTGAHVVSGCPNIVVWDHQGGLSASHLIALDLRSDIALIATNLNSPDFVSDGEEVMFRAGEQIFTVGRGIIADDPKKPVLTQGMLIGKDTGNHVLVVRARLRQGSSGGPVVDADGTLLGMVIGYYTDKPQWGAVLPIADIRSFLQAHGADLGQGSTLQRLHRSPREILMSASVLVQCAS
jgi:S1-C subfamily serine protease